MPFGPAVASAVASKFTKKKQEGEGEGKKYAPLLKKKKKSFPNFEMERATKRDLSKEQVKRPQTTDLKGKHHNFNMA